MIELELTPAPEPAGELLARYPRFFARALAARGVNSLSRLDLSLEHLHAPQSLRGIDVAAERLARAITQDEPVLIVGDFDADGATGTALAVSVLRAFGAKRVDYLVPNRFHFGYGLSPELARLALERQPAVIVTVDNGISSVEGVALAQRGGADVIVTDHHLPGAELPKACAIVNPNALGCRFPSKAVAGVGVIWYVLCAVRTRLTAAGFFEAAGVPRPNLAHWLDLVALGTVADVVPLDRNNRILIHNGLRRIRAGKARPGLVALAQVASRAQATMTAGDLGFALGPRLNAAGRLEDMGVGIECLLAESLKAAAPLAKTLDELNASRREIEAAMTDEATALAQAEAEGERAAICVYHPSWHQGVVGIVAGRMREAFHRPAIAFADAGQSAPGALKGSARSIPGLHLRDALANVAARFPGLIDRFGGHAMAAGLTIRRTCLTRFAKAFEDAVSGSVTEEQLRGVRRTDGELSADELSVANAMLIAEHGPWGQAFEEPAFHGGFDLVSQRVVGERHLKLALRTGKRVVDAIAFDQAPVDAERVRAVYRLGINDYMDAVTLQLVIEALEPCEETSPAAADCHAG